MSEQTMWAVKGPDGQLRMSYGAFPTEGGAWHAFAESAYTKEDLISYGYRAVEVRITEVQDGA